MLCKICGTENVSQAMFCENCGAKLEESSVFVGAEVATAEKADIDYSETIEEEMYEYEEEPPKKSKSVKVLIILIIVLAMLVCGAVGVLIAMHLSGGTIEIFGGSSSSSQQSDDKDKEDKEEADEEQTECESLVEDVLKAIENENPSVVEENLGFDCGDSKTLAVKMAKTIADEFGCSYDELVEPCEKVMKEYFNSMENHIKDSEKVSGDYVITVSFTRLDKEKILRKVLEFDAEGFVGKIEEEEDPESETVITEEAVEDALEDKIIEVIEEEMSKAELIKDEIEFLVANDDGEWFIYTDECDFEVLENELTLEE